MSDTIEPADGSPDAETLAGEYVLGVLDEAERRAVRLRSRVDPELSVAIEAWQRRLAPLVNLFSPIAPPAALWDRIAAAIAPVPADEAPQPPTRLKPRGRWAWPAATGVSLALAAGLAAFIVLRPTTETVAVASIAPINAPAAAYVVQVAQDGTVSLIAVAPKDVPAGRDLQLWYLPAGATKVSSLGLLPREGRMVQLPSAPASGSQLLVSQEPAGGSPTGQPTGPVLYGGTIAHTGLR